MLPKTDFEILNYNVPSINSTKTQNTSVSPPPPLSEPLVLQTASTWTHAGAFLDPLCLPPSYHTWSNGTFQSNSSNASNSTSSDSFLNLFIPFLSFLHTYLKETYLTHYCLTIRAQKSTSDFDIPRWHVDRRFFEEPRTPTNNNPLKYKTQNSFKETDRREEEKNIKQETSNWKLATALIGPGTLFLKDSSKGRKLLSKIEKELKLTRRKKGHYAVDEEHVCRSFRCLGCAEMAESVRVKLAEEIVREEMEIVQVGGGELAVFRVEGMEIGAGDDIGAAMHSEPVMSRGDRVFVHVVPGREEELRRLVEGWGLEFPRDWSVGVLEDWVDK